MVDTDAMPPRRVPSLRRLIQASKASGPTIVQCSHAINTGMQLTGLVRLGTGSVYWLRGTVTLRFSLAPTPADHSLRFQGTQIDDGDGTGHSAQRTITELVDLDRLAHRCSQPAA